MPAAEFVANLPIVAHVLGAVRASGARPTVVATSQRCATAVRACLTPDGDPAHLRFLEAPGPMTLGAALGLAATVIGDAPCVVHAGDGLLAESLVSVVDALQDDADAVLVVHHAEGSDERLSVDAGRSLGVAQLDPARSGLSAAGVCALGPGMLRRAAALPGPGCRGPAELGQRIVAAGGTVALHLAPSWRRYTGDAEDLLELNRIALDHLPATPQRVLGDGNRIEGRVVVHEGASVRASVLVGPLVVGPGAQIADAYIGPYTSIGAGARIEGTEIERSIIAPGVSIIHVGSRLTDSVVGRDARVSRDFSLPRALRLSVGPETDISLC